MGKTKEYTEHETEPVRRTANSAVGPVQQTRTRSNRTRSQQDYHPSPYGTGPETPPTSILLRLIWTRIRRSWISLRFKIDALTKGVFKEHTLIKVGVLAGIGYWAFTGGIATTLPQAGLNTPEGTSIFSFSDGKPRQTKYKSKNEAAPVSASELFAEEAKAYIEKYAPVAREEQAKYGVPASISLAQGLIESRAGTSKLAKSNNNHFGIKCFSRQCKKGHCSNFTDDTHKDFFRKFDNPWGSWREHSVMLSRGRYKSLHKHGNNYRQWAYGLKSIGYATDRTYAEKLIGVIERYGLNKFDS
jgi:flagellum-specific peptidoglycan hydrolase FlgJ